MQFLPAHPHRMADHHVHGQVIVKLHLGVGGHKGHQGQQGFGAELAVLRSLDFAEQVIDEGGEVALARGFLAEQGGTFEPVAALQLVADDDAAAMVQQVPDAGVEVPRHPLQGP